MGEVTPDSGRNLVSRFSTWSNVLDSSMGYEKGGRPLVTDQSLAEPLQVSINKLLRGEPLRSRYNPVYDIDSSVKSEDAFASLDVTKRPGFDLADVASVRAAEATAKAEIKLIKEAKRAELQNQKAKAAAAELEAARLAASAPAAPLVK